MAIGDDGGRTDPGEPDRNEIPEHLWRYPTRAAIDSLALRFGLPNEPNMQDWEYEVADPDRIDEFLAAYESVELTEDERFTLMETILESFEQRAVTPDVRRILAKHRARLERVR